MIVKEVILYKIIIDFFSTILKYNLSLNSYTYKIYDDKIYQYTNTDLQIIKSKYVELIKNLNLCDENIKVHLENIKFKYEINNINVEYYINDILNKSDIIIKYPSDINSINLNYVNNLRDKIYSLLLIYVKIYNNILKMLDNSFNTVYSKCYAEANWTTDLLNVIDLNVILKYNLFEVDIETIDNYTEKTLIKKIINI